MGVVDKDSLIRVIVGLLVDFELDVGLGAIRQHEFPHLVVRHLALAWVVLYRANAFIVAINGFRVLERKEIRITLLFEFLSYRHLLAQTALDHQSGVRCGTGCPLHHLCSVFGAIDVDGLRVLGFNDFLFVTVQIVKLLPKFIPGLVVIGHSSIVSFVLFEFFDYRLSLISGVGSRLFLLFNCLCCLN